MKQFSSFLTFLSLLISLHSRAQDMKAYNGHWEAPWPNNAVMSLMVEIRPTGDSMAILTFAGTRSFVSRKFAFVKGREFVVNMDSTLICKGIPGETGTPLRLLIQTGQWQYHLVLHSSQPGHFKGKWRVLLADPLRGAFYLSIENPDKEQYEAYAFMEDHRWPGFGCTNFTKSGDSLHFNDFRTGLAFEGKLLPKAIQLRIRMAGILLTTMVLHPSVKDWQLDQPLLPASYDSGVPRISQDGLEVGNLREAGLRESLLKNMVDSIRSNQLTRTQSVLIARRGRLVYEQYFDGYDATIPHDMRSASKSVSSALIGIAMDRGILKDTGQKLFDLLPPSYRYAEKSDVRKSSISIANLLTMSSGLDAIDFGVDRKSAASEDVYQSSADWLKTVVEAPMINQPGSHANYSSANPYLLGVVLNEQLKGPLAYFTDAYLCAPLGIDTYIVQSDDAGHPYFGGGMLLRPRDMLKFGLLYAQNGRWKDRQLISKKWVELSFGNYLVLENHPEKNGYGFLWWHYAYQVGNKTIQSIEARGAGGQYIFIIPEYELVVVITSANFRNGRVWQPEKIMENYILKALE